MRIGVLGLGRMGAPIAAALAENNEVTGFDPVSERTDALRDAGSRIVVASTQRTVALAADVLLTVLPGPAEFDDCANEIVESLGPGSLWIDLTSNDPRIAERVAARAADHGILFAAASMSGGPQAARSAGLRFSVSGADAATHRAREALEPAAAPDGITIVGLRVGDAYSLKLLANLLWFTNAVAVSEAMLLGTALGFEPARLLALLADGPGSSVVLEQDFAAVLEGDYLPEFGIHRVVEEFETLTSLAHDDAVPFELSTLVMRLHREALERFGPADGELLVTRLLEDRAGRRLRTDHDATPPPAP